MTEQLAAGARPSRKAEAPQRLQCFLRQVTAGA
ncbi:hypothetical protein JOD29_001635 [Lysinibacillus composti]|nr:hypothetical protein [Lysinibacillus composti]